MPTSRWSGRADGAASDAGVTCPETAGDAGLSAGPDASDGAAATDAAGARVGREIIDAEALAAANALLLLGSGTVWLSAAAAEGDGLGAACDRINEVAHPPVAGGFTITGEAETTPVAATGDSDGASSASDGLSSTPASPDCGGCAGASCVAGFMGSLGIIVVAGSISMAFAALPIIEAGPVRIQTARARYRHPSTMHLLPMAESERPWTRAVPLDADFAIMN
jgi:hypothetical protein